MNGHHRWILDRHVSVLVGEGDLREVGDLAVFFHQIRQLHIWLQSVAYLGVIKVGGLRMGQDEHKVSRKSAIGNCLCDKVRQL